VVKMNKKTIIIIAVVAVIVAIGIYLLVTLSRKTPQTASQITYSTNAGSELSFNQSTGGLSRFNPDTNQFETIARIPDKQVIDFQLSADNSSLLYTFDPYSSNQVIEQGVNTDAQTLKVK